MTAKKKVTHSSHLHKPASKALLIFLMLMLPIIGFLYGMYVHEQANPLVEFENYTAPIVEKAVTPSPDAMMTP